MFAMQIRFMVALLADHFIEYETYPQIMAARQSATADRAGKAQMPPPDLTRIEL